MYKKSRSRGECSFVNGFFVVFSQKREPFREKYQTKVKELPISLGEFVFRSRARIPAKRFHIKESRFANMVSRWTSQEAQSRDKQASKCKQIHAAVSPAPAGALGDSKGGTPFAGYKGQSPLYKNSKPKRKNFLSTKAMVFADRMRGYRQQCYILRSPDSLIWFPVGQAKRHSRGINRRLSLDISMPRYLRPPQGPWGTQRGERPLRGKRGSAP